MKLKLSNIGYSLNSKSGVWSRLDYTGIAYNDGVEVERDIATIIEETSDISVLSGDLRRHCTSWPFLYHLSSTRANILRPFHSILKNADVLEIGAGCGAITRYLGECGANVVALEGSPRRAAIVRARTRNLTNVNVIAERFDRFELDQKFDVISLIGVLEYANLFTPEDDPPLAMLQHVRTKLKPNGKLIIGIENQLGLKYFSGAPEDHLGQPMYGIEGRYRQDQPQTYGRKVLTEMLRKAGFMNLDFLAPFPDYKFPISIITEKGFCCEGFDASALAWQSVRSDPQLPPLLASSPELVWPVLMLNGLALDMANSFLVVAGESEEKAFNSSILAWHFTSQRSREFCKETQFVQNTLGSIDVCYYPLESNSSRHIYGRFLAYSIPEKAEYVQGRPLSHDLIRIVTRDGWRIEDVGAFLRQYLQCLISISSSLGMSLHVESADDTIPGSLFDASLQNIIVGQDGKGQLIDTEWTLNAELPAGWLIFRSLYLLIHNVTRFGTPASDFGGTPLGFFIGAFNAAGFDVTESKIEDYAKMEVEVQVAIAKRSIIYEDFLDWMRKTSLPRHNLSQAVGERDRQLASLNQTLNQTVTEYTRVIQEGKQQIHSLQCAVADGEKRFGELQRMVDEVNLQFKAREQDLHLKEEEIREIQKLLVSRETALQEILASRSWRATRPLRQMAHGLRGLKGKISHKLFGWAKGLYQRLPLTMGQKRKVKNFFFTCLGFAFHGSAVYQQWYANHQIHALSKQIDGIRDSGLGFDPSGNGGSPTESGTFDGRQEWVDFQSLRHRILELNRLSRENQTVSPPAMIDLEGEDLSQVVAQLHFPPTEDSPLISIIIPAFNHLQLTMECLLSIAERTGKEVSYEVLVADDASTDDTPLLLSKVNNLRVVSQGTNLGFLRNCNIAAQSARGQYVLFLNNDVQVTEGWLSAMVRVFKETPNVGAVGPMLIFPNGQLQEAGARLRRDGSAEMIGLYASPDESRFNYRREVDYCSGACLMVDVQVFREVGGFDEGFAPAYCEDSDLCLRIRQTGKRVMYCPESVVVHHLSRTTQETRGKMDCVVRNSQRLLELWQADLDQRDDVKIIAFYLPQFHPIPENDLWWGKGFTEWTNVAKARPNFPGHYQPRLPADLGYYDLRLPGVMEEQARLAQRYGIDGFCFYYYWFGGKRLLEYPVESLLNTGRPDIPFCLCWANENWTRRWDGNDQEILMGQKHSDEDDGLVIRDLMRYFTSPAYIRIAGRPLLLVYRVTEFPDFRRTAELWRSICRKEGVGEIYLTLVESFELARDGVLPATLGCDAAVEFPPQGYLAHGMVNGPAPYTSFRGLIEDYRDLALHFASRPYPAYKRFPCVVPGWDNTPRRQQDSFCFHHATPGAFQAWTERVIETSKQQLYGDERLVFVNAWNEWAEGAYLEPDRRFGHAFLEAIRNARDSACLLRGEQDAVMF